MHTPAYACSSVRWVFTRWEAHTYASRHEEALRDHDGEAQAATELPHLECMSVAGDTLRHTRVRAEPAAAYRGQRRTEGTRGGAWCRCAEVAIVAP